MPKEPAMILAVRPVCRPWAAAAVFVALCWPAESARADAGFPIPLPQRPPVQVRLTYQGAPLDDRDFLAMLLVNTPVRYSGSGSRSSWDSAVKDMPGLEARLNGMVGEGTQESKWVHPTSYGFRTESDRAGWVRFAKFGERGRGPVPTRFRLAVYLPSKGKVFVTDLPEQAPEEGAYLFAADLTPDGGGTLRVLPAYATMSPEALALPLLVALGLSVAIELPIVALWALMLRRRYPGQWVVLRAVAVGLVMNLLTVPALVLLGVYMRLDVGPAGDWFRVFAAAAAVVTAVDAAAYALIARAGPGLGTAMSVTANLFGFLFGCCGVLLF
jgi:hypothetical protein